MSQRGNNPFQQVPIPVPCQSCERGSTLFSERALSRHLDRNAGWLQYRPRTSEEIEQALYPLYNPCGVSPEDARTALNYGLWDAGYTPSDKGSNPTWCWNEGA